MRSRTYYIIAVISLILIIIWLHIALLPEGGLIAILDVLLTVNLFWLLPAFGLFGVAYILRAVRWWQLLRPFKTGGNPASLFPIIVGGIFLTYVVPLRAGDIATPYWLREKRGTRFTAGLSSVLLARVLDFACLTLIVVVFSILVFGTFGDVFLKNLIVGGILAVAFIALLLLIR
ncbi:MAG: lysylphosphatidylglycerol synthase transmembrane domain-containing protein, partial [Promethearchaeota archaeon]